jgi:hypothetical protein
MREDQILDEVRRLPAQERMDVLEGVLELVVPPVSAEQEQGLVKALDEADRGELVDGPEAIAKQRRRVLEARSVATSSPGRPKLISHLSWIFRSLGSAPTRPSVFYTI